MKILVPNEAIGIMAMAAAKVSTKYSKSTPNTDASIARRQPHFLSRRLVVQDQEQHPASHPASNSIDALVSSSASLELSASTSIIDGHQRQLVESSSSSSSSCDATFLSCVLSPPCRSCFTTMQANNIDWTNIVPETPCTDIIGFLVAGGHCLDIKNGGTEVQDGFCAAFDACVVWDENSDEGGGGGGSSSSSGRTSPSDDKNKSTDNSILDCTTLTTCSWPGMHSQFLGDGVCHDSMPGCYNSPICNFDGGDCCEDTCHYPSASSTGGGSSTTDNKDIYGECGMEGYACRDPKSVKCQSVLAGVYKGVCETKTDTTAEENSDDFIDNKKENEVLPTCSSSETLFRLVQYDSWGDGWDKTVLTLKERGSSSSTTPIYKGGLEYGSQGTVHLCLTKQAAKCYQVTVENGTWGNEISWELRPLAGGAPVLAAGGFPSDCTFPLGGITASSGADACPNTCDSTRPDTKIQDPNYKSYKDMESCIEKKCLIQVGTCAMDSICAGCMQESLPDYCFANDNFNTLVDCSMCSCSEKRPAYCDAKSSGGDASSSNGSSASSHSGIIKPVIAPGSSGTGSAAAGGVSVCSPEQTMKGTYSLVEFSGCAMVDQMMAMVTDFDNDNFGMLDLFEDCAHTYDEQPLHGGKSALDCMKILHNLIMDENNDEKDATSTAKNAKGETLPENIGKAISTLASNLYHNAEAFCECAANANKETPVCSSFINFKTLLFEAVDACKSLDAIDCAAWEEFYTPCKKNLVQMYGSVDFDNKQQCNYVESQCGGAGPFPAFRRLDCGGEISKSAWDFHTIYERGCLKSSSSSSSSSSSNSSGNPPSPDVSPPPPSTSSNTPPSSSGKKQYQPYSANGESDAKKPYYSPTYSDSEPSSPSTHYENKSHHVFRYAFILAIIVGIAYVVQKRRRENFNYARFRQLREARNYTGGLNTGGDYMGVSMMDSCSFEPPSLPPTPSDNI